MNLIDTIADIIDGIKALPACAEAVRELTSVRLENARLFLTRMGYDTESLDRILHGSEIGSDYLDRHDFKRLELINERDLLRRKIGDARAFLSKMGHTDADIDAIFEGERSDYGDPDMLRERHAAETGELSLMLSTATQHRDLLQRKLDYLLTPHECAVYPCVFDPGERVLYRYRDEPPIDWYSGYVSDLSCEMEWRPVDLTHFEE